MTSSFAFTLCLAALVGSVSAVRRGAESIATDEAGVSTCCCYSDAGDCASKSSRQGQTISVPSSAEPYCCKLRKGTGCEYHKKKYGTPLAEILGETGTVHDSMCTFDVATPSEPVPDEEPVKPPAEEPNDPVEELTDVNDPVPPVEDAVDESEEDELRSPPVPPVEDAAGETEEDELRSPAAYVPEGENTPATPFEEVNDGNDPVPPVEDAASETDEDELRSPAGYVPEGEKTPATPSEELQNGNDPAPPVEQDVAGTVDTEDDEGAEPGKGAAAGTPPITPAITTTHVDLTGFMQNKKEVTVDGTTYTCCCSVEDNSLKCDILDVNTAEKAISWKGGCGGLKGSGWHSYKNMGSKYDSVPDIGTCRVETSELTEKLLR